MLSFLLATLTIAPAEAPLAREAAPSVATAEAQARGRKPGQGAAQGRKPTAKKKNKQARPKPGPLLRGMIGGAAKAKERIEQKAGGAQRGPGSRRQRPPVRDEADEEQILDWFNVCDHNENAWISFREARASLRFDRPRFTLQGA